MVDTTAIDLFLGLDLGKEFHDAHGRTVDGKTVHDKRLPTTEPKLLDLFSKLGHRSGGRGSGRQHRRAAADGGPRGGLPGGLPARPVDAAGC